jgi:hypothetical protein
MGPMWLKLLAALAGLGLAISAGVAQGQKQGDGAPSFKQIRLTDKMIQGFISAEKQLIPLASKLEAAGDKVDPALQKQIEGIAKSSGFSSLEELGTVGANISLVLGGLDPGTGQFTEPAEMIRKEMERVRQDKQMSQKDKNQALSEMQQALKTAVPLQYKENVALVRKYQKELDDVLGPGPEKEEGPGKK